MKRMITLLLALVASQAVQAHKRWLLPTDFSLSDAETVTVDFTASNNLFYVDKSMPLQGLRVLSPKAGTLPVLNPVEGARRSSFDLEVAQQGTHRVVVQGEPVYFLSYRLPGAEKPQFERGPLDVLKKQVPEAAEDVRYARSTALIETYITLGAASAPPAIGQSDGLSLQPASHPNELYSDEPGEFVLLLNGVPTAGLALVATREGTRYRDSQEQVQFVSGDDGLVVVEWQGPGRYLLEAAHEMATPGGEFSAYYYNYFLTVEVLAP